MSNPANFVKQEPHSNMCGDSIVIRNSIKNCNERREAVNETDSTRITKNTNNLPATVR